MVLGHPPSASCPLADFNQDGVVDDTDLNATILFEFIAFEPQPCSIFLCPDSLRAAN